MKSKLVYCLLFTIGIVRVASADLYYDVNFSSPAHTAGLPPTLSSASNTPSLGGFGETQVVPSYGPINNQALLFNTMSNKPNFYYDQIRFEVWDKQDTYHISFDVYTENLIGSHNTFAVILDLPVSTSLYLTKYGTITFPNATPPHVTYKDRTLYHFDISIDARNNREVILMDDQIIADGSLSGGLLLYRTRFSLGVSGTYVPDHSTNVVVDNIIIENGFVIPEPSTIGLMGISAITMILVRKKQFR